MIKEVSEKENRFCTSVQHDYASIIRKGIIRRRRSCICVSDGWQLLLLGKISLVAKRFTNFTVIYGSSTVPLLKRFEFGCILQWLLLRTIYYTLGHFELRLALWTRVHRIQISIMVIHLGWNHKISFWKNVRNMFTFSVWVCDYILSQELFRTTLFESPEVIKKYLMREK